MKRLPKPWKWIDKLLEYANRFGAYVVQPESTWYSWDPIHISRRHRIAAWRTYMSCWSNGQPPTRSHSFMASLVSLQRARPRTWKLFGIEDTRSTYGPIARWNDHFSFLSPFFAFRQIFFLLFHAPFCAMEPCARSGERDFLFRCITPVDIRLVCSHCCTDHADALGFTITRAPKRVHHR